MPASHESRSRRLVPAVLLLATVLLGLGAASIPLFDPDEARFARTSLEMQRSGDPVVPTFEGQPRLIKPPLLHWIQSSLFSVFGTGEWVVRLPSILATLGTLLLTGVVARRRFGEQGALWAIVVKDDMVVLKSLSFKKGKRRRKKPLSKNQIAKLKKRQANAKIQNN